MKRRERRGALELNFRRLDSLPKGEYEKRKSRCKPTYLRRQRMQRTGKKVRKTSEADDEVTQIRKEYCVGSYVTDRPLDANTVAQMVRAYSNHAMLDTATITISPAM